jgi:hypothetical protein
MSRTQAGIAAVRPAIISVTDASNTPIPNGGSTSDTSITLSGTAEANSVVVIYDGPAFKGSASVVSAGTWAMSISNLAAETHRFTARTADGTLISDEWVITTGVVITPVRITSVTDSTGVIGEGGSTTDTSVTVSGTAAVNEMVEIFDGVASQGIVRATSDDWILLLNNLTAGPHSIKAVGLYETQPVSAVHNFTVSAINLLPPTVPKAYGDGTRLSFDTAMYYDDYLSVMIDYTGMDIGQKIQLRWGGPVVYQSQVLTVTVVEPVEFQIPRMEVIDVIGGSVTITYSVALPNGHAVGTSTALTLRVDAQPLDLIPPTISANNGIVTVLYTGMNTPHTGRVRWEGAVKHDTGDQNLDTRPEEFVIPTSWIAENAGLEVSINYTVYRGGGQHLLFSRVLRKRM